jgi:vanillate/3-O-methylgallate O-demethylase
MAPDRKAGSLQDLIDATPNLVDHLYNDTPGPHSRIRADS